MCPEASELDDKTNKQTLRNRTYLIITTLSKTFLIRNFEAYYTGNKEYNLIGYKQKIQFLHVKTLKKADFDAGASKV